MVISYDLYEKIISLNLPMGIESIENIKIIFDELDDKVDIFEFIKDKDIGDNYICYGETGEYGCNFRVCTVDGKLIYELFMSDDIDDTVMITSFWNDLTKKGIYEVIRSNGTDHFIDGKYHSTNFTNDIMEIIRKNTKTIPRKFPILYHFMVNDRTIAFIPKNEINQAF